MSKLHKIETEITEATFDTTRDVQISIHKAPTKLFAGFSRTKREVHEYEEMTITQKHRELYLCQLAMKDGILSDFSGGVKTFPRKDSLDELSDKLGLEKNTLRNSCVCKYWVSDVKVSSLEERNDAYMDVARAYGRLKAIAESPDLVALRAINSRALSGKGHNARRTGMFVHQYDILLRAKGKYMSPHKIEKMIWAVREKALTKHGQKISFEQALQALGFSKSTSKAATIAVACKRGWMDHLGWHQINFRVARSLFVEKLRK